jgi:hypothetical protein
LVFCGSFSFSGGDIAILIDDLFDLAQSLPHSTSSGQALNIIEGMSSAVKFWKFLGLESFIFHY